MTTTTTTTPPPMTEFSNPTRSARISVTAAWVNRLKRRSITSSARSSAIAVKINEAVSASALLSKPIEVSEREYGALRRVLADRPLPE